jgi:Ser/Thr protein kinase RdoA (MazF antagonist)
LFCKLPPLEVERRPAIARTGMGRREALFYATLAGHLEMRVPSAHVARYDDRDGSFVLLLEDLVTTGCRVSDGTWGVAPDAAARALEELAELHVRFEDPARRASDAPWVPAATYGSTYGTTMLRYGLDHHRGRLSDDFAAVAEIYIAHNDVLHSLWHRETPTVIHGDPHIGNLFDDHGRTGFLDWGIINVGSPMRDVGYFLTMAMDVEERRRHERDLLRHYLDARHAMGGSRIGLDEAWMSHRLHAAYTVPACCQIVVFPDAISERRRVFSEAFLARAEAALADLDARGALREVAGL